MTVNFKQFRKPKNHVAFLKNHVLDANTIAHYERRAMAAGRSWLEQICYELAVNRGLVLPDHGDREAMQRANLLRRIREHRILHG